MPKLLFVIPAFKHGGTNKSLLNLIPFLKDRFEISVLALSHLGPYIYLFPKEVKIIERDYRLGLIYDNFTIQDTSKLKIHDKIYLFIKKALYKGLKILLGNCGKETLLNIAARKIESMNFDTIIAMQEGDSTYFTSKITGRKIAWVRSDYKEYSKIVNKDEEYIYSSFKSIICVSEYTRKTFVSIYPNFENRCKGIHNMIDFSNIIELSNEKIPSDLIDSSCDFSMVSIGRLSKVKQFSLIPGMAEILKNKGINFRWYIIGDGEEYSLIAKLIKKHNVEDLVVLLGELNNPYPLIKWSDLVVVTSFSEACPNVLNESKILHTPVITNNFGSAVEFIENDFDGVISKTEDIPKKIEDLIVKRDNYQLIKSNLSNFEYSNDEIIKEILKLLE